jgi:hypothetical protein
LALIQASGWRVLKILSVNECEPNAHHRGQKNLQISAKWMRGGARICVPVHTDRRRKSDTTGTFLGICPDKGRKCFTGKHQNLRHPAAIPAIQLGPRETGE